MTKFTSLFVQLVVHTEKWDSTDKQWTNKKESSTRRHLHSISPLLRLRLCKRTTSQSEWGWACVSTFCSRFLWKSLTSEIIFSTAGSRSFSWLWMTRKPCFVLHAAVDLIGWSRPRKGRHRHLCQCSRPLWTRPNILDRQWHCVRGENQCLSHIRPIDYPSKTITLCRQWIPRPRWTWIKSSRTIYLQIGM